MRTADPSANKKPVVVPAPAPAPPPPPAPYVPVYTAAPAPAPIDPAIARAVAAAAAQAAAPAPPPVPPPVAAPAPAPVAPPHPAAQSIDPAIAAAMASARAAQAAAPAPRPPLPPVLARHTTPDEPTYGSGSETTVNVPSPPPPRPPDAVVGNAGQGGQFAAPPPPPPPPPPPTGTTTATGLDPAIQTGMGAGAVVLPNGTTIQTGVNGYSPGVVDPNDPAVRAALEASTAANPDAAGGGSSSPDLSTDPALVQQRALGERIRDQAAAGYLASAKDALLGYGSQSLAKEILDNLLKDPRMAALMTPADEAAFIAQLSDNPDTSTSTLGQMGHRFRSEEHNLDEALNNQHLFYSGTRAKDLGEQSYSEQTRSGAAKSSVMSALGKLGSAYQGALTQADSGDITGFQQAYDRALQEALNFDTGAGAASTVDGTDGKTTPPPTTTTTTTPPPKAPPAAKTPPAAAKPKAPAATGPDDRGGPKGATPIATPKKKKNPVYGGRH